MSGSCVALPAPRAGALIGAFSAVAGVGGASLTVPYLLLAGVEMRAPSEVTNSQPTRPMARRRIPLRSLAGGVLLVITCAVTLTKAVTSSDAFDPVATLAALKVR